MIEQKKVVIVCAGLHVAAGLFKLGMEALLDNMTSRKRRAQKKNSESGNKKLMDYTTTLNKVQAIRAFSKHSHKWKSGANENNGVMVQTNWRCAITPSNKATATYQVC